MSFFNRIGSTVSDSEKHKIWNAIPGPGGIEAILKRSENKPQLIYKHSPLCSVCFLAKKELEKHKEQINNAADLYMVNVIRQHDVSNAIESELKIRHESPQVIIIKDRMVIWNGSHWQIKGQDILTALA